MRLAHCDLLDLEVDDEDRVGSALHVLHATEVRLELREVGERAETLTRRQQRELALSLPALKVVQALDALVDRLEVGQQTAEPAVVDVRHPSALGSVLDGVAGLLLGADEQHDPAAVRDLRDEVLCLTQQRLGPQEVDYVDPIALAVDVAAHLGVPAARLMPEVNSGLQQLLDPDRGRGHGATPL